MTIFEKIARREIPAEILYEEEDFLVIRGYQSAGAGACADDPEKGNRASGRGGRRGRGRLGKMLAASGKIARQLGVYDSGYRLVINHGPDAGETVRTCIFIYWEKEHWPGRPDRA